MDTATSYSFFFYYNSLVTESITAIHRLPPPNLCCYHNSVYVKMRWANHLLCFITLTTNSWRPIIYKQHADDCEDQNRTDNWLALISRTSRLKSNRIFVLNHVTITVRYFFFTVALIFFVKRMATLAMNSWLLNVIHTTLTFILSLGSYWSSLASKFQFQNATKGFDWLPTGYYTHPVADEMYFAGMKTPLHLGILVLEDTYCLASLSLIISLAYSIGTRHFSMYLTRGKERRILIIII